MARFVLLSFTVLFLSILPPDVYSAKILGIFPHVGKSHYFVFEAMMKELATRGHQVHVLSHFPQKNPLPNFKDISLEGTITEFEPTGGVTFDMLAGSSRWLSFYFLQVIGRLTCDAILNSKPAQDLMKSKEQYDVVIMELFNTDCLLGFPHLFKSPHIALTSNSLMPWSNDRFANPDHPAYIPHNLGHSSSSMNFMERLQNTVDLLLMKFFVSLRMVVYGVSKEHFGASAPAVEEIAKNTSLVLVNSHWSLTGVRPMVPAVVEVGGIHVKAPNKLPEELDRWLTESKHGVIYFSMGSMLRGASFPAEKLAAFLQAFGELPQRVLWKFEADTLPGKPDNVRIAKWLPQRDVLNHKNVRVFMTHCGFLGTTEAVVSGVPMVAMPIFGDQHYNCAALKAKGIARIVQYGEITKESVLNALKAVIKEPSYQENSKRMAKEFLDRPLSPMETAIFWIEYVIRHRGAPQLQSAATQLTWYQYLLLDVALVLLTCTFIVLFVIYFLLKKVVRLMCGGKKNKTKDSTKRE